MIFSGHGGWSNSIAFSPDGTRLAAGSNDGTARIWSVSTGRIEQTFSAGGAAVWKVSFSPSGNRLAAGTGHGEARVWELESPAILTRLNSTFVDGTNSQISGTRRLPPLLSTQLRENSLQSLLDIASIDEDMLIATKDSWQILEFARMYTDLGMETFNTTQKQSHFTRADRLYRAAIDLMDDSPHDQAFMQKLHRKMLAEWQAIKEK